MDPAYRPMLAMLFESPFNDYSGKRTREWLKFKAINEQEAVIVGYTEPRRSRKYFGSLVLAVRDKAKKRWIYAGHVGTGFDQALTLTSLSAARARASLRAKSQLTTPLGPARPVKFRCVPRHPQSLTLDRIAAGVARTTLKNNLAPFPKA